MEEQQSELTQLRERVEMSNILKTCPLCGTKKPDGPWCYMHDTPEVQALRARVKELESDSITHLGIIGEKESRIRELEEAMPDAFKLRVIAGACNELRQHTAEGALLKMADRIENVMNGPRVDGKP